MFVFYFISSKWIQIFRCQLVLMPVLGKDHEDNCFCVTMYICHSSSNVDLYTVPWFNHTRMSYCAVMGTGLSVSNQTYKVIIQTDVKAHGSETNQMPKDPNLLCVDSLFFFSFLSIHKIISEYKWPLASSDIMAALCKLLCWCCRLDQFHTFINDTTVNITALVSVIRNNLLILQRKQYFDICWK